MLGKCDFYSLNYRIWTPKGCWECKTQHQGGCLFQCMRGACTIGVYSAGCPGKYGTLTLLMLALLGSTLYTVGLSKEDNLLFYRERKSRDSAYPLVGDSGSCPRSYSLFRAKLVLAELVMGHQTSEFLCLFPLPPSHCIGPTFHGGRSSKKTNRSTPSSNPTPFRSSLASVRQLSIPSVLCTLFLMASLPSSLQCGFQVHTPWILFTIGK